MKHCKQQTATKRPRSGGEGKHDVMRARYGNLCVCVGLCSAALTFISSYMFTQPIGDNNDNRTEMFETKVNILIFRFVVEIHVAFFLRSSWS